MNINLNEARLIPVSEFLKIAGISKQTFLRNCDRYPPVTGNGSGNLKILNLDIQAWLGTGGKYRTHLDNAAATKSGSAKLAEKS